MRLIVGLERFLEQMRVERDWTDRTIDSYSRVLRELAETDSELTFADFDGKPGTEKLRAFIARRYGATAASTRATRISYFRSFFAWAEDEGYVNDDPARRIKRPPKRKPDVLRPTRREVGALLGVATGRKLPLFF